MEDVGQLISEQFGEEEIAKMVQAFYRRVRQDDVIGPLYPIDDWEGAENRLRDFLVYRFGGSGQYIQERGHPRLGMRHAPFVIGVAEKDRWLEIMNAAIDEIGVPDNKLDMLRSFFESTANFLQNR